MTILVPPPFLLLHSQIHRGLLVFLHDFWFTIYSGKGAIKIDMVYSKPIVAHKLLDVIPQPVLLCHAPLTCLVRDKASLCFSSFLFAFLLPPL